MSSTSTTVTIPTKLTAGDQLYQGNISGFRRYLTDIQQANRELFLLLDPELRQLEEQQRLAWGVGIAGFGAGMVMVGYGLHSGHEAISSRTANDTAFTDALLLSGGGVLVAMGSVGAILLLQPSSFATVGSSSMTRTHGRGTGNF